MSKRTEKMPLKRPHEDLEESDVSDVEHTETAGEASRTRG